VAVLAVLSFISAISVAASANAALVEFIPAGDTWRYVNATPETTVGDVSGFQAPGYDDSAWFVGQAPFGNIAGPLGPDYAGDFSYQTYWNEYYDPALRKTIVLSHPVDMTVELGVDNGFSLWVNGNFVTSADAEGYTWRWEYVFAIPQSFFVPGGNVIAVQLEDHGGATAFDMRMTPVPATLSLLAVGGLAVLRRRGRASFAPSGA
jgi:hypothetical protein